MLFLPFKGRNFGGMEFQVLRPIITLFTLCNSTQSA
jgi:hypothetical protein